MVDPHHQVGVLAVGLQKAANLLGGNAGISQDRFSPISVLHRVREDFHTRSDEVAEHPCEGRRRDRRRSGGLGPDVPAARRGDEETEDQDRCVPHGSPKMDGVRVVGQRGGALDPLMGLSNFAAL